MNGQKQLTLFFKRTNTWPRESEGIKHLANSLHKDLNTLARPKSEDGQEKDIWKWYLFMWMVTICQWNLHWLQDRGLLTPDFTTKPRDSGIFYCNNARLFSCKEWVRRKVKEGTMDWWELPQWNLTWISRLRQRGPGPCFTCVHWSSGRMDMQRLPDSVKRPWRVVGRCSRIAVLLSVWTDRASSISTSQAQFSASAAKTSSQRWQSILNTIIFLRNCPQYKIFTLRVCYATMTKRSFYILLEIWWRNLVS